MAILFRNYLWNWIKTALVYFEKKLPLTNKKGPINYWLYLYTEFSYSCDDRIVSGLVNLVSGY